MKHRLWKWIFLGLALALSHGMCAAIAYSYSNLYWSGRYAGGSAPPRLALILAIPFLIAAGVCLALSRFFARKEKQDERQREDD